MTANTIALENAAGPTGPNESSGTTQNLTELSAAIMAATSLSLEPIPLHPEP
jgi:hypothetical protein